MSDCETNIVNLSGCDDNYVSSVLYNIETEILTITLLDGTIYTVTIPSSGVTISEQAGNQVVELPDGIFVPTPTLGINSLVYENGDNLVITSDDDTVIVTSSKVGNEVIIDLSAVCDNCDTHPTLTVTPNVAYTFNEANQTLGIPLPTLVQTSANVYTYTANNGTGNVYTLTFHPALTINNNVPFSWNVNTQVLNLPIPTFTDNEDGTYTYDPGDGTTPIELSLSGQLTVNFGVAQSFNSGTQTLNLPSPTLVNNNDFTYTYNPGDGGAVIILQEYPAGVTNLLSTTLVEAITEIASTNVPWSKEGLLQNTVDVDVEVTDDIYRTGSVGIGLVETDVIQGLLEVKGTSYITASGTEAKQVFQVNRDTVPDEIVVAVQKLANRFGIEFKTALNMLMTLDTSGNLGIGEVDTLLTLPNEMYDAEATFTISNYNDTTPPAVPVSVFSVTDFVLMI